VKLVREQQTLFENAGVLETGLAVFFIYIYIYLEREREREREEQEGFHQLNFGEILLEVDGMEMTMSVQTNSQPFLSQTDKSLWMMVSSKRFSNASLALFNEFLPGVHVKKKCAGYRGVSLFSETH
jgi:hypothetical protein